MGQFVGALLLFGGVLLLCLSPFLLTAIPIWVANYNNLDTNHSLLFYGGIAFFVLAIAILFFRRT